MRTCHFVCYFLFLFEAFSAVACADGLVQTVVLSGDRVPGAEPGVLFTSFATPILNASGQTAFLGILDGTGIDANNDRGIFSEGSGTLVEVVREGSQAPGADQGVAFSDLSVPLINASGQLLFTGSLTGTGVDTTNDRGIYSERSGTLAEVAREGGPVPSGGNDVVFRTLSSPVFNARGQVAFSSSLTGLGVDATNDRGIYSGIAGALEEVVREGQMVPQAGAGVVLSGLRDDIAFNDSSQIVLGATLGGTGITPNNNDVVYLASLGTLTDLAREGGQVPDASDGVVFSAIFGAPVVNSSGQTAFNAFIAGAGIDAANNGGVYSGGPGMLSEVAREGEQAPEADAGIVFSRFSFPIINTNGHTAFLGTLTGAGIDFSNDIGLYSEGFGTLTEVAREGSQAPDAVDGVVFRDLTSAVAPPFSINALGQTAFVALLAGPGVNSTNDRGIYATNLDGLLVEVAREGSVLDVNDDPLIQDLRTISSLGLFTNSGNEDGRRTSFNDLGQIVFRATFTDGSSGVFVSNLVAVPEPSGLLHGILASIALVGRRRYS